MYRLAMTKASTTEQELKSNRTTLCDEDPGMSPDGDTELGPVFVGPLDPWAK